MTRPAGSSRPPRFRICHILLLGKNRRTGLFSKSDAPCEAFRALDTDLCSLWSRKQGLTPGRHLEKPTRRQRMERGRLDFHQRKLLVRNWGPGGGQ